MEDCGMADSIEAIMIAGTDGQGLHNSLRPAGVHGRRPAGNLQERRIEFVIALEHGCCSTSSSNSFTSAVRDASP